MIPAAVQFAGARHVCPARFVGAVCLHAIVSGRGMFVGVFCWCEACLSAAAGILFFDR